MSAPTEEKIAQYDLGFALAEGGREFAVNSFGILTEGFANPEKFHHIQPPFALLDSPDKRLLAFQRIGQLKS